MLIVGCLELCDRVPLIIETIRIEVNKRSLILLDSPRNGCPLAIFISLRLLTALIQLQDIKARVQVELTLVNISQALWSTLIPLSGTQSIAQQLIEAFLHVLQGMYRLGLAPAHSLIQTQT